MFVLKKFYKLLAERSHWFTRCSLQCVRDAFFLPHGCSHFTDVDNKAEDGRALVLLKKTANKWHVL